MRNKKLTLEKSVLTRLQKDQLAAVEGGEELCQSVTNSTISVDIEMLRTQDPEPVSCCRKSC